MAPFSLQSCRPYRFVKILSESLRPPHFLATTVANDRRDIVMFVAINANNNKKIILEMLT